MSNSLSAALAGWALIAGVGRGQSVTPPNMAVPTDQAAGGATGPGG